MIKTAALLFKDRVRLSWRIGIRTMDSKTKSISYRWQEQQPDQSVTPRHNKEAHVDGSKLVALRQLFVPADTVLSITTGFTSHFSKEKNTLTTIIWAVLFQKGIVSATCQWHSENMTLQVLFVSGNNKGSHTNWKQWYFFLIWRGAIRWNWTGP